LGCDEAEGDHDGLMEAVFAAGEGLDEEAMLTSLGGRAGVANWLLL